MSTFSSTDMTIAQRFDNTMKGEAAWSFGCPSMLHSIDKSVFKKDDKQKGVLLTLKKQLPKTRQYKFKTILKGAF